MNHDLASAHSIDQEPSERHEEEVGHVVAKGEVFRVAD